MIGARISTLEKICAGSMLALLDSALGRKYCPQSQYMVRFTTDLVRCSAFRITTAVGGSARAYQNLKKSENWSTRGGGLGGHGSIQQHRY